MVEMKKSSLETSIMKVVIREYIRYWFSSWWLLLVVLPLLAVGLVLIQRFELIGLESARWTLSALVQAGAALIGILFVAIGLLWNQAHQEREKLKGLVEEYMRRFAPNTTAVIDLHRTLSEVYGEASSESSELAKMHSLLDVFKKLMVLVYAASRHLDMKVPSQKLFVGSPIEAISSSDRMELDAVLLDGDEFRFFSYLMQFDEQLSSLAYDLKLKNKGSPDMAETLRTARKIDRVDMSLYRLRFFRTFTGGGLKIISCMWLLCLTAGLLILVSIDRIPPNLLSGLVATPVAIGIIAVGITLSLGLRAIRSE